MLGGEQLNVGLALDYYRRPNLRFMLNLLHFRTDSIAGNDRGEHGHEVHDNLIGVFLDFVGGERVYVAGITFARGF